MIRYMRMIGAELLISMLLLCVCRECVYAEKNNIPEYVFVYAENQADDYPTTISANYFAEQVYDKTEGNIQIVVKSNAELGDEKSVIEQMKFGGIDFSRVSISLLSTDTPELAVLMMPYLYSSQKVMKEVLNSEIGTYFKEAIASKQNGVRALEWYNAGARNFYCVDQIDSISDLGGIRIRVQPSDIMKDLVQLLGGIPVQMNYSDVYRGFQTGTVDGAENNFPSYQYTKHCELAKYCITDEHMRIPEIQLVSDYTWSLLTEEEQQIISECAQEAAEYEWKLWEQAEKDARDYLEKNGVTITEISVKERKDVQKKIQPLYDKYCSDYLDIVEEIRGMQ